MKDGVLAILMITGKGNQMIHRTRKLVMYPHLNANGTLFGGQALAWIDEEAGIFATCQMGTHRVVTAKMSTIEFKSPGRLADVLTIGCQLTKVGTTSITMECEIVNKTTGEMIVHVDEIVFVCLDEDGKPTPHGIHHK